MTVYANVGHILLKRGNTVQSTAYKGPLGELTLDTDLHTVRVHDGETFGGNVILASNTEVWALSNSISTITGLDAGFISNINTLLSNAATQSSAITTLQGQVGQTYGNANVAVYLPTYTGNVSSGNLTVNNRSVKSTYTVQYLAVGGGGGGGAGSATGSNGLFLPGGGGGAGGVVFSTTQFISGITYSITVGSGGIGGNAQVNYSSYSVVGNSGNSGGYSSIFEPTTLANIVAYGGGSGGGGSWPGGSWPAGVAGSNGASGGGGGSPSAGGGSANSYFVIQNNILQGSNGNPGYIVSGSGPTAVYAGGTGGGINANLLIGNVTATYGSGGTGNGLGTSASSGTGNGGNSGTAGFVQYGVNSYAGGNGGSGVVYITYCSPTQLGTGGTVWSYTQNGYTYWMHRFTSSGTYIA